jgi:uncharacterized protein (TIGR03086 family)
MVPDPVYISVTDPPSGVTGLLAGAISYMLGVCALVRPGEMALPTPCADWDLGMLLGHLSDSMADLETAIRTGHLDLERPPDHVAGDPVETLRDRAAELLCAVYGYGGPGCFVAVGGLPVPAGLVACTGAVEIAVHGWDVSAARARASCGGAGHDGVRPIPAVLATRMLRLGPLLVVGREGLFAVPVDVPAQASPSDRLVGYLGRCPG